MRVFLVRHAEAAPGDPDELRPLTGGGPSHRADARRAARGRAARRGRLEPVAPRPRDRRADRQAARLAAETDARLAPGADAQALRAAVAGRGETVVAVGHQPDCTEIVLELTGEQVPFAPGALLEVEL